MFLDRDGVINKDNPDYTFLVSEFRILPFVIESLRILKSADFKLVVVTNQSGIAQGIYTQDQMRACHDFFQKECGGLIDHFYFSPYHPSVTESLLRKPGTLMFEKAVAKFKIDISKSWMIGDRGRDIIPAMKLGLQTIQIGDEIPKPEEQATHRVANLKEAVEIILGQ